MGFSVKLKCIFDIDNKKVHVCWLYLKIICFHYHILKELVIESTLNGNISARIGTLVCR